MQDQSENESVGTEWVSIFLEETHMPNQTYRLLSFFFSFLLLVSLCMQPSRNGKKKKKRRGGKWVTHSPSRF